MCLMLLLVSSGTFQNNLCHVIEPIGSTENSTFSPGLIQKNCPHSLLLNFEGLWKLAFVADLIMFLSEFNPTQ